MRSAELVHPCTSSPAFDCRDAGARATQDAKAGRTPPSSRRSSPTSSAVIPPQPTPCARRQPAWVAIRRSTRYLKLRPCRWTTPPRTRSFTVPDTADFLALLDGNAFPVAVTVFRRPPVSACQAQCHALVVLAVSSLCFLSASTHASTNAANDAQLKHAIFTNHVAHFLCNPHAWKLDTRTNVLTPET